MSQAGEQFAYPELSNITVRVCRWLRQIYKWVLISVAMDSLSSVIFILLFVKLYISISFVSACLFCVSGKLFVSLPVLWIRLIHKSHWQRTSKSLFFSFCLSFIASFAFAMFWWSRTSSSMNSERNVIRASEAVLSFQRRWWGGKFIKPVKAARSTRQRGEGHVLLDNMIRMLVFVCVLVSVCESINKNWNIDDCRERSNCDTDTSLSGAF